MSGEAYKKILDLSKRLSEEKTRNQAMNELDELSIMAEKNKDVANEITLSHVTFMIRGKKESMKLLILPSIFSPESWTYTFLGGLFEVKLEEYEGKTLIEVGTGSGWVCLVMAKFTNLKTILGVDLNPQSSALALCNAYLNCDEMTVRKLSFGESDLLKGSIISSPTLPVFWDFIVGCIPQVLNTELKLPSTEDAVRSDAQALLDLSNYTSAQNVYEDIFGLGLIAKLLDEVPEKLAPFGKVIFNLAGRPGRYVINQMFSRRGFNASVLNASRVSQAGDTDIYRLVELEQSTKSMFEFFIDYHSEECICAETAHKWLEKGHLIWHEVGVWIGNMRLQKETINLRKELRGLEMIQLLESIDMTDITEEHINNVICFLRRLKAKRLPYPHEAGDMEIRTLVVEYLRIHFKMQIDEHHLFIGPERKQMLYSLIISTCDVGDSILISNNCSSTFSNSVAKAGVKTILINNTLSEILLIMENFEVKMVVFAVEPEERSNISVLKDILLFAKKKGIIIVIDNSSFFQITNNKDLGSRSVLELIARDKDLCSNLVVMCGLTKNLIYPDFELTIVLHQQSELQFSLEIAAEVSYSRIGILLSWLYERLFSEMFEFRMCLPSDSLLVKEEEIRKELEIQIHRSKRMEYLAQFPAFANPIFDPNDPKLIRLDYGENESDIPSIITEALLVGSINPDRNSSLDNLTSFIVSSILDTRAIKYSPSNIVLGQGVWPLVSDFGFVLRSYLNISEPLIALLKPCYGLLAPTFQSSGCRTICLTLEELLKLKGDKAPHSVVISQPSNPAGTYISHEDLLLIATYVVDQRCILLSDEIFGLLNLNNPLTTTVRSPVSLEHYVSGIGKRTVIMGGLSKEYSCGGLRLGFAAMQDATMANLFRNISLGPVHRVVIRASEWIYSARSRGSDGALKYPERWKKLREYLSNMCLDLNAKRKTLLRVFPDSQNVNTLTEEIGGLFISPDISSWYGKRSKEDVITSENVAAILYRETSVVVNSPKWCGDINRIRVVFSISKEKVNEAALRIENFTKSLR